MVKFDWLVKSSLVDRYVFVCEGNLLVKTLEFFTFLILNSNSKNEEENFNGFTCLMLCYCPCQEKKLFFVLKGESVWLLCLFPINKYMIIYK